MGTELVDRHWKEKKKLAWLSAGLTRCIWHVHQRGDGFFGLSPLLVGSIGPWVLPSGYTETNDAIQENPSPLIASGSGGYPTSWEGGTMLTEPNIATMLQCCKLSGGAAIYLDPLAHWWKLPITTVLLQGDKNYNLDVPQSS